MDASIRDLIYTAPLVFPQLVARNETSGSSAAEEKPTSYKLIGLALAVGSGLFIGVSFVLKKYGLLKANAKYNEEAGEGYGYLKNWYWWGGMTLMIIGEICNFAAYLFADAILVTPLGALSVVVCAILSSFFLKERLSFVGKVGCFCCIVGAVVIACNAPEQPAISTIQDFKKLFLGAPFLAYGSVIIVGCTIVAIWVAPKYGKKSMLVYLTVCSLIGGLSVVCIQGIGAAITAQSRGIPQFNQWFLYFVLVFVIATLVTEIIYLNKALNLYNAALVTPTYYVYFTSATIVSDAILYRGFRGSAIQIITVVLGFLQICSGVVLLQLSKSSKDVPDTAVFSGDVDQVRILAEQEEPEYEPRADAMRGTAALIRSMSQVRHKRETKDIMRIKEEQMTPIGEGEEVEWDGLRRRRTMSSPRTPSMRVSSGRRRTIHPPLGMSHFPEEDEAENDPDNGMHPGFWSHFKRKPVGASTEEGSELRPVSHSGSITMREDHPGQTASPNSSRSSHIFGLPKALRKSTKMNESPPLPPPHQDLEILQDTAYHGAETPENTQRIQAQHVQWSDPKLPAPARSRSDTVDSEQDPSASFIPGSPPHISLEDIPRNASDAANRRQFSFSSIFNRSSSHDGTKPTTDPNTSPIGPVVASRSGLSFSRRGGAVSGTEEERAGLVKGDASIPEGSPPLYESPEGSPTRSPQRPTTASSTLQARIHPSRGDSDPRSLHSSTVPSTLREVAHTRGPSRDDALLTEPSMSAARISQLRVSQVDSEPGNPSDAESIEVHLHPALRSKVGLAPIPQSDEPRREEERGRKKNSSDDDNSPDASGPTGPAAFI